MDIITLRHERFGTTSVLPASYTPAGRVGARRSVNHALRAGRLAPPQPRKTITLRMRHGAHRRRARADFREVLLGGDGLHFVRRRGHFLVPLGLHLSRPYQYVE